MRKITDLIRYFFIGYIDFDGRCSRRRFWAIVPIYLISFIGIVFLSVAVTGVAGQIIFWSFMLSTLVPFISLIIKRLHDFNITGYAATALLAAIFIGGVWIFLCLIIAIGLIPASKGNNKFGPDAHGDNVSVFD